MEEGGAGRREGGGEGGRGGGREEAGSSQPGPLEPPIPLPLECVNTMVMQAKMRYLKFTYSVEYLVHVKKRLLQEIF